MKKNDYLQTPEWVYKPLGHFDLDPCAGLNTDIADINWCDEKGHDGLLFNWFGFVFCNPPFSQKELWIEKMINHGNGILVLPERGSAPWSAPLSIAANLHWVMGKKINFDGGSSSNNVGSVLFLFGNEAIRRVINSGLPGQLKSTLYYQER